VKGSVNGYEKKHVTEPPNDEALLADLEGEVSGARTALLTFAKMKADAN
jgi:hypothetical protein